MLQMKPSLFSIADARHQYQPNFFHETLPFFFVKVEASPYRSGGASKSVRPLPFVVARSASSVDVGLIPSAPARKCPRLRLSKGLHPKRSGVHCRSVNLLPHLIGVIGRGCEADRTCPRDDAK